MIINILCVNFFLIENDSLQLFLNVFNMSLGILIELSNFQISEFL